MSPIREVGLHVFYAAWFTSSTCNSRFVFEARLPRDFEAVIRSRGIVAKLNGRCRVDTRCSDRNVRSFRSNLRNVDSGAKQSSSRRCHSSLDPLHMC